MLSQVHFFDLPDSTGVYQPIIIEQCFGLEVGDEIGLFDMSGLTSDDCSNQYSEILVGAGMAYFQIPKILQPIHLILAFLIFGIQFYVMLINSKSKKIETL